jgi:hypothetical protein
MLHFQNEHLWVGEFWLDLGPVALLSQLWLKGWRFGLHLRHLRQEWSFNFRSTSTGLLRSFNVWNSSANLFVPQVAVWKCGGFLAIVARGFVVEDLWIGRRQLCLEGPAGRAPITSHFPAIIQSVPWVHHVFGFQRISWLANRCHWFLQILGAIPYVFGPPAEWIRSYSLDHYCSWMSRWGMQCSR